MATFTKLVAVKDGGGNPGAPSSSDTVSLTLQSLTSELSSFDLTASSNALVAFDASSLDFGNATANPAFNFLGTGDFAVAGDALFSATGGDAQDPDFQVDGYALFAGLVDLSQDLSVGGNLSVTTLTTLSDDVTMESNAQIDGNLSVTGTSTFTGDATAGNLTVNDYLFVGGNASVSGNLVVSGTLITKDTETVLVSDNYIDMNSDYTTVSSQDSGFTFNYSPIENKAISSFGENEIVLSSAFSANVVAGDFILVAGLDSPEAANEGIYEVASVSGSTITIETSPSLTFVKSSITASQSPGLDAKAALVNLAVIRTSSAGALEWATGSNSSLSFGEVPFDGYSGSQSWTSDLTLTGDLIVAQGQNTSYSLELSEVISDPTVDANVGKIYTKSVTTNNVAISELFYTSDINGSDTPVQITKNGGLNVDVLTFSLQEAYDDGNTIVTNANLGAVSISAGQNLTDALDLTGNLSVDGEMSVTGVAGFSSTGGDDQTPDFQVDGYALFGGTVDLDGSLDADVSGFDVSSSGSLNLLAQSAPLNITASSGDVVITGTMVKLSGSSITSSIAASATATQIGDYKAVAMTANGLVAAQANALDVIALGVAVASVDSSSSALGKIAEFGSVDATVETSITVAAGDKLYLSAADAGAVTNVAPTASNTTVFLMGVALAASSNGVVTMALRPQFLYSNY